MTQCTDEPEIRGHEQAARIANTRDLPSRIADPARLRAIVAELRAVAEQPPAPVSDDPRPVIRALEAIIALHEEKQRRLTVQIATVLEACALRIEELEAQVNVTREMTAARDAQVKP